MKKFFFQARMCAAQAFDGGVFYIASGYVLRLLKPLLLMFLWSQLPSEALGGIQLSQLLTYTLWSSVLAEQLDVHTAAGDDFWQGNYGMRYTKPVSVYWQIVAETVGRWIPGLLFYSIPAAILALFLGVPIAPVDLLHCAAALLSLALTVSLGFCIDFLFMTLAVRLRNASYQATLIRYALMTVCSGALIPFAVLPFGLGRVFELLPFGSLAGAPLAIYSGLGSIGQILLMQIIWNALLWPLAAALLKKSQERLVSFGG